MSIARNLRIDGREVPHCRGTARAYNEGPIYGVIRGLWVGDFRGSLYENGWPRIYTIIGGILRGSQCDGCRRFLLVANRRRERNNID